MGHHLLINDDGLSISPQIEKTAAINKLPTPRTPKQVKSFIGAVNFLAFYIPQVQTLLAPLYDLTRKKNTFLWTSEHETSFVKIKHILISQPVIAMPNSTGLFRLYCDTSRIATGASLWQIQNNKERCVGYYSKRLPPARKNYGVSELELTGMLICIHAFRYLLRNTSFEV